MKASCPRCNRGTEIETELGDFPVRCQKCGALLRRSSKRDGTENEFTAENAVGFDGGVRRIQRGALAGLLIARSSSEELSPAIIHASTGTMSAPGSAAGHKSSSATTIASLNADSSSSRSILQPESRREIARAAARQKALRQAQLRASLQSFSALSWAGVTLIALLLLGAAALKAESAWRHPTPAHADTLRINP